MKHRLQTLLDCTYEFAGLIELALRRDEVDAELLKSLRLKGIELQEMAEELTCDEASEGLADTEVTEDLTDAEAIEYMPQQDILAEEIEDEEAVAEAAEAEEAADAAGPAAHEERRKRLPKRLTLNDRFLYARKLFGGDREAMDKAIAEIRDMDNDAEIDAYCYRLGWDLEDPEVLNFIDAVK